MIKEIDLIELFSGTCGFSQGIEAAGFKIKKHQYSEVDKHAIANTKYNYPNAEYIGSVTDVRGKRGQADIITFGSPCQDFSLAGKRKGMEGQRSSLIMEAIRIISEVQPSVFIWENVKGTFSSNNGADFWAILNAFTNIGNYRLEWQLLNTSWFLPQNRERIYLVGHLAGRSEPGVFPIGENDKLSTEKKQSKKGQSQTKHSSTIKASGSMKADDTFIKVPKKASCLTAGGNSGGLHSDMTVIPVLTPDRKEKRQNGRRFKKEGEPAFTLSCQDQHGVLIQKDQTKGNSQGKRVYDPKGVSSTLSSSGGGLGGSTGLYELENRIRRLTEIECERLQGFPDDWTRFGIYNGETKEISKTQRYKLCGNAVSTVVAEAVASKLNIHPKTR